MEKLSAYMDGEAEHFEEQQMLAQLDRDAQSQETWETYHLIGDAMRGEPALQAGFTQRLSARLAAEPTVLAPRRGWNRPVRYALSAAASVAAVAFVATLVYQGNPVEPGAVAQRPVAVAAAPAAAERGPGSGYLLAHQEFSPSSTYQGVAPYVRTVSAGTDAAR